MKYGTPFSVVKSFYDWCVENNRMDLNDRFDEDKNGCTTKDVGYKSNLKWWFKCPRGLHDGDQYVMYFVTNNPKRELLCRKCHSVAQVVIDKFGQDYLERHWHKDNTISPWDIPAGSGLIYVIIQCDKKDYHVYKQVASSFADGIGCPYCINRKVHHNDSLAVVHPEVIERWSDKNKKAHGNMLHAQKARYGSNAQVVYMMIIYNKLIMRLCMVLHVENVKQKDGVWNTEVKIIIHGVAELQQSKSY